VACCEGFLQFLYVFSIKGMLGFIVWRLAWSWVGFLLQMIREKLGCLYGVVEENERRQRKVAREILNGGRANAFRFN
jgi:hypothetical protein